MLLFKTRPKPTYGLQGLGWDPWTLVIEVLDHATLNSLKLIDESREGFSTYSPYFGKA